MSEYSTKLGLPYMMPAQAQKHVVHNEALKRLDMVTQLAVLDRDRTLPPSLPNDGDRHIVAPSASGVWSGQDGKIAAYVDGAWEFLAPREGWISAVVGEGLVLWYDGTNWSTLPVSLSSNDLQDLEGLGVNAGANAANRLVVSSPATLLTHEGAGHQLKINKAAAAETASLLFQSDWAGKAEMGLAGQDDFSIKVSPDGSTWHTAVTVDRTNGVISAPATPAFKAFLTADTTIPPGVWTAINGFTELFDHGGDFNATTGAFTTPTSGLYSFSFSWRFKSAGNLPSQIRAGLGINSSSPTGPDQITQGDATLVSLESSVFVSTIFQLQAGDQVFAFALSAGGESATVEAVFSSFYGLKIA